MRRVKCYAPESVLGLFMVAAAIIVGCSPTAVSPTTSGSTLQTSGSHRTHPLVLVSTRVKFYNSGSSTIVGMGSSACWSISPTPLPSVAPSDYSGVETLTYDTSCAGSNILDISYGVSGAEATYCTFATQYSSSGFSYSVTNTPLTACTAMQSSNVTYNELFSYDPSGSLYKRHSHAAVIQR
jgi:hypothetical protein